MRGDRCPSCGGDAGNNWFDRSLCACGVMHTCCRACGFALDECLYDKKRLEHCRDLRHAPRVAA